MAEFRLLSNASRSTHRLRGEATSGRGPTAATVFGSRPLLTVMQTPKAFGKWDLSKSPRNPRERLASVGGGISGERGAHFAGENCHIALDTREGRR